MASFRDLNIEFLDALWQIFNIKKHRSWDSLRKEITIDKISETYKVYATIFPKDIDRYSMVSQISDENKLYSIFHGTLDGLSIINNIARYSLYTDQIITFHPLQNPVITSVDYDPVIYPEQWKREFVNALYYYIVLNKWVRKGIVHIVQSPFDYDGSKFDFFRDQARKRIDSIKGLRDDPEIKKEFDEIWFEKHKRSLLGMPIDIIENTLKGAYPNKSTEEISEMAKQLKEYEKTLPLHVDFGETSKEGELLMEKTGGNLEEINALCKLTGAHSYSTQKLIIKQIEAEGTNSFWTKFSKLYSGLNLSYLDDVDTSFALMLREEDRLSGMRKAFRDITGYLTNTDYADIDEPMLLEFNDRITHEERVAQAEWEKILDETKKRTWASLMGTSVLSLLVDPTKFIVPAIGVPSSIAINKFFESRSIIRYRKTNPFSVFVDLQNKRPSFFSDLKNCVF